LKYGISLNNSITSLDKGTLSLGTEIHLRGMGFAPEKYALHFSPVRYFIPTGQAGQVFHRAGITLVEYERKGHLTGRAGQARQALMKQKIRPLFATNSIITGLHMSLEVLEIELVLQVAF